MEVTHQSALPRAPGEFAAILWNVTLGCSEELCTIVGSAAKPRQPNVSATAMSNEKSLLIPAGQCGQQWHSCWLAVCMHGIFQLVLWQCLPHSLWFSVFTPCKSCSSAAAISSKLKRRVPVYLKMTGLRKDALCFIWFMAMARNHCLAASQSSFVRTKRVKDAWLTGCMLCAELMCPPALTKLLGQAVLLARTVGDNVGIESL